MAVWNAVFVFNAYGIRHPDAAQTAILERAITPWDSVPSRILRAHGLESMICRSCGFVTLNLKMSCQN